MNQTEFIYVTYIRTTPEKLWEALTKGEWTTQYFFGSEIESTWELGSKVTYSRSGEVADYGEVLTNEPFSKLSFTWTHANDQAVREVPTCVTFLLQKMSDTVKLTLKHENLVVTDFVDEATTFEGLNNGWPAILSNLKSLLETGKPLSVVVV